MSTHNICFCREIRKILCGYPLLSVAVRFCSVNGHWRQSFCIKEFKALYCQGLLIKFKFGQLLVLHLVIGFY